MKKLSYVFAKYNPKQHNHNNYLVCVYISHKVGKTLKF